MEELGEIEDPRRRSTQRHKLLDILAVAQVASVCDAEGHVGLATAADDRRGYRGNS